MVKERKSRLPMVVKLISEKIIGSQEELSQELKKEGFNVTQATLSRDLKLLKVSKIVTSNGFYRYVLPTPDNVNRTPYSRDVISSKIPIFHAEVISLDFSYNLAIIRTRDGYGTSLAYDIDLARCPHMFSTVSGADTVLCPLKPGTNYNDVMDFLRTIIPGEVVDRAMAIYGNKSFSDK